MPHFLTAHVPTNIAISPTIIPIIVSVSPRLIADSARADRLCMCEIIRSYPSNGPRDLDFFASLRSPGRCTRRDAGDALETPQDTRRMPHSPATYGSGGAVDPDTRWCRDLCAKYMRNPGAPVAFTLITALMEGSFKTVPLTLKRQATRCSTARRYSNLTVQHRPHPTNTGLRPAPTASIDRRATSAASGWVCPSETQKIEVLDYPVGDLAGRQECVVDTQVVLALVELLPGIELVVSGANRGVNGIVSFRRLRLRGFAWPWP